MSIAKCLTPWLPLVYFMFLFPCLIQSKVVLISARSNVTIPSQSVPSCDPFGLRQNSFNYSGVLVKTSVDCQKGKLSFVDMPSKIQFDRNLTKTILLLPSSVRCLDEQLATNLHNQLLENLSTLGLPSSVILLYPFSPSSDACIRVSTPLFSNNSIVIGQAIVPQDFKIPEYNVTSGFVTLQVSQELNPWNILVGSQLYNAQYWVFFALKMVGASILLFYILKAIFRGFFEKNIRTALALIMIVYLIVTAFFPTDALHEIVFVDPVKAIFDFSLLRQGSFKVYVVIAYLLGIVSCYLLTITWCRIMLLVHSERLFRVFLIVSWISCVCYLISTVLCIASHYVAENLLDRVTLVVLYINLSLLCIWILLACISAVRFIWCLNHPDMSMGARRRMRLITLIMLFMLLSFLGQRLSNILLTTNNIYAFIVPALVYSVSELVMYGIIIGFLCLLNSVESTDGVYVDYWEPSCYVHFGTGQSELDRLTSTHTQQTIAY
ncbi:hypothetical protein K7432_009113 [Basidiobolus ranarum]|uniref:Intimal thickness related receptor IRP domain-containing protein n=1 Tax=Basidiobolus ranarum TaxID=34480 RepID=A0ABR2WQT9_9FUNG